MKSSWEDRLDIILEENSRNSLFGANMEWGVKGARKYFTKLENWGCQIRIVDYDTIVITLPTISADRENVFLHILTAYPRPSNISYNIKKDQLRLAWE